MPSYLIYAPTRFKWSFDMQRVIAESIYKPNQTLEAVVEDCNNSPVFKKKPSTKDVREMLTKIADSFSDVMGMETPKDLLRILGRDS